MVPATSDTTEALMWYKNSTNRSWPESYTKFNLIYIAFMLTQITINNPRIRDLLPVTF